MKIWKDKEGRLFVKYDTNNQKETEKRTRKLVNAKDFLRLAGMSDRIPYLREFTGKKTDGITEAQRECLHSLGIGYSDIRCKGNAMEIISVALKREKAGLATPAMMKRLEEMGVKKVHLRTKKEAAYIFNGGSPEEYEGLIIFITFDMPNIKACKATACSRAYAKNMTLRLQEIGGTNIRFKVIECD